MTSTRVHIPFRNSKLTMLLRHEFDLENNSPNYPPQTELCSSMSPDELDSKKLPRLILIANCDLRAHRKSDQNLFHPHYTLHYLIFNIYIYIILV